VLVLLVLELSLGIDGSAGAMPSIVHQIVEQWSCNLVKGAAHNKSHRSTSATGIV